MFSFRSFRFHPLVVITTALAATAVFGLLVALIFRGERRDAIFMYSVPIGIPFVTFVFDRLERWSEIKWAIDVPVIILALLRSLVPIPLISGHALFLSYALLTTQTRTARLTAALIMMQVVYLKTFVWKDETVIGGMIVGIVVAVIRNRMSRKPRTA
ncbi:MAG: hypothetical protein K8L97_09250 [Anaerolineae bacterium]|nr:hypothetical protein [Anaerolineae bacterium]